MKSTLFLAQTDTTIGFLCQDPHTINQAKGRNKQVLLEVDSLQTLKSFVRVPQKYKNMVRKSRKTTFIYPNCKAIRVVFDSWHLRFLRTLKWAYSSSANLSGKDFDINFATSRADTIIEDKRGLFQAPPSKIYKINQSHLKRIR
ncbi:Sua5 YciO YrdC YwlC family protein [Helicobacter enhydrae]|uniref:Sua5 YciO YrdC YwlC family protein n=1 Tax=Helicobacter enhydrae TaxID=222136 RepID=A0A1B1U3R2_9HELI|nr:Sua5 YciO YrdC YwlC family protein [Helicobacter enhydrae]ANV97424.1 Sua5 YciO YrdC YwlC family protein [Helicobacter enhydrae]